MDSNYEAQKQLARQRLATRREQARVERLLREGHPESRHSIRQLLVQLFRRSGRRREKRPAQESRSVDLAAAGKSRD